MDIKALTPALAAPERAASALPVASAATAPVAAASSAASSASNEVLTEATVSSTSAGGVFMRSSDSEGLPRWVVMTALRAYGLNLNKTLPEERQQAAQAAAQTAARQNEAATQSVAAAPTPKIIEAIKAVAVQAAPTPKAAAPKIDTKAVTAKS